LDCKLALTGGGLIGIARRRFRAGWRLKTLNSWRRLSRGARFGSGWNRLRFGRIDGASWVAAGDVSLERLTYVARVTRRSISAIGRRGCQPGKADLLDGEVY